MAEIVKELLLNNNMIDITLTIFSTLNNRFLSCRTHINFSVNEHKLLIDPYYLGLWLGDGTSASPNQITNIDDVIIDYIYKYADILGLTVIKRDITYTMSTLNRSRHNSLWKMFKQYKLINNKHIPLVYKTSDKNVRLTILAGLIDTDGSLGNGSHEITQKSNKLTKDILFLARSCGFAAYSKKCKKGCMYKGIYREGEYNRMIISGHIIEIPTLIKRKQAEVRKQIKNILHTGTKIEFLEQGNYYDINVDNNGRFVLDDFTIVN